MINNLTSVIYNDTVPCQYHDVVDLRVIVMTFDRASSLQILLDSLDTLELDGDRATIEIWIDRSQVNTPGGLGTVNNDTLHMARTFNWSRGETRVHVHARHAGIYGQWIDTWRPREGTHELALLLEDDLSVSPFAYRWLRAAHNKYQSRTDIAGYTLQSEGVNNAKNGATISRPAGQAVFFYKLIGSWGFAPHPDSWRGFQDWYHTQKDNPGFHPYVSNAAQVTNWYKGFEKQHKAHTMWTMWHIYYSDYKNLYTVYSNIIKVVRDDENVFLSENRQEPGLHFHGKGKNATHLLTKWHSECIDFPDKPIGYGFGGNIE